MDLNEVLLYGGGIAAGIAALAALVLFFMFRIKSERLKAELNKEYGEF